MPGRLPLHRRLRLRTDGCCWATVPPSAAPQRTLAGAVSAEAPACPSFVVTGLLDPGSLTAHAQLKAARRRCTNGSPALTCKPLLCDPSHYTSIVWHPARPADILSFSTCTYDDTRQPPCGCSPAAPCAPQAPCCSAMTAAQRNTEGGASAGHPPMPWPPLLIGPFGVPSAAISLCGGLPSTPCARCSAVHDTIW